jgi:hypothetical protein
MQVPMAQRPSRHAGAALASAQETPHAPQCARLVSGSTQAPPQHVRPAGQGMVGEQLASHTPPAQNCPDGHSASRRHCTQTRRPTSQKRRGPAPASPLTGSAQSSSLRQPSVHERVTALQ